MTKLPRNTNSIKSKWKQTNKQKKIEWNEIIRETIQTFAELKDTSLQIKGVKQMSCTTKEEKCTFSDKSENQIWRFQKASRSKQWVTYKGNETEFSVEITNTRIILEKIVF